MCTCHHLITDRCHLYFSQSRDDVVQSFPSYFWHEKTWQGLRGSRTRNVNPSSHPLSAGRLWFSGECFQKWKHPTSSASETCCGRDESLHYFFSNGGYVPFVFCQKDGGMGNKRQYARMAPAFIILVPSHLMTWGQFPPFCQMWMWTGVTRWIEKWSISGKHP